MALLLLAAVAPGLAQTAPAPVLGDLRFSAAVQMLGIFTHGAQGNSGGALRAVDNRLDWNLRRGRFSVSGRAWESVDFRVVLAFDNIGRDRYSGSRAGPSQENSVNLWDAFWTWHANRTWVNVTAGFFRPQIGRENLTSGFRTNSSMDKLVTQAYTRQHTLGRSSGREVGINLGGLYSRKKWGFYYNLGWFDTTHELIVGQAGGAARWSPLFAGRWALTLGDPEMSAYGIDYQCNYFGRRRGVTTTFNYSRQGTTSVFRENELAGVDVLANYRNFNLDAELDFLKRTKPSGESYADRVWHLRAGYNIRVRTTFIEPVVAVVRFHGAAESPFQNGRDRVLDTGLNWYIYETRVRLNLHYTRQSGSGVSLYSDGRTFVRGSMAGIGLQFVY